MCLWLWLWLLSCGCINPHHDWIILLLQDLFLALNILCVCIEISFKPFETVLSHGLDLILVFFRVLLFNLLVCQGILELEAIRFQAISSVNPFFDFLIFIFELFSILNHLFDFFFRKSSLFIGDGDLALLTSGFVVSCDIHDSICINVKGHLDLGDTSRRRRNAIEVECSQQVVVLCQLSLTFEHLD